MLAFARSDFKIADSRGSLSFDFEDFEPFPPGREFATESVRSDDYRKGV